MLDGCRILVVEDEFLLAQDLKVELEEAGAMVLGPEATVERALATVRGEPSIDAAVLDINLGGHTAFPVADALAARDVPVLFCSGYDAPPELARYPHAVAFNKPFSARMLIRALARLIHPAASVASSG